MGIVSEVEKALGRARKAPPKRIKVHECPTTIIDGKAVKNGICGVCKLEGKTVPREWVELPPGTPYAGSSPLVGREVTLRGDDRPSRITGVATPVGGGVFGENRSRRYRCQGSFVVETPLGRGTVQTIVPKSVVRNRMRRKDPCPDASGVPARGFAEAVERDAGQDGLHPHEYVGGDLPWPHQRGSSPCCVHSGSHPSKLDGLLRAWLESGEESDWYILATALRAALPKSLRSMEIETKADALRALKALRDHCWAAWQAKSAQRGESRKSYRKRKAEAQKERARQGLDSGARVQRRTIVDRVAAKLKG